MLEKLILYFVVKTKGHITKTQLIKFLYLADLYAVKWTEKQLTDLDWRYYYYGPWHQDIENTLKDLEQSNKIITKSEGEAILIKPNNMDKAIDYFNFSLSLELMLDNIRREWAGSSQDKLNDLLYYVYSTEPMKYAQENHKPEEKASLNLELEHKKLLEELGV